MSSRDNPAYGHYRKKPVVIEAWQVTPGNMERVARWCGGQVYAGRIYIDTKEGTMQAAPGHWVIRGVKDEFYPCKPDIFEATYELEDRSNAT